MPTPDFIVQLRTKIGHDFLWLPGVAAVVLNAQGEVLLAKRSDNGKWTTITGILEPGEEPAAGIEREIAEETGVEAHVSRLLGVSVTEPVTFPNGDQTQFLTVEFAADYVSGTARVNDEESSEVAWFAPDALPALDPQHRARIQRALDPHSTPRF